MNTSVKPPCRHLVLILGDQLDEASSAFDEFDPAQDCLLMIEAMGESTHVWSHKIRTTLFLSAMRHHAAAMQARGWQVDYRALDTHGHASLADGLIAALEQHRPTKVVGVEPGDWRVKTDLDNAMISIANNSLNTWATALNRVIEWREDRHFLCSLPQFRKWAGKSTHLRMEFFYRQMRKQYKVLMDETGEPVGGQWNFDADNRKSFGKAGPKNVPQTPRFELDAITCNVISLVNEKFSGHPGQLENFNWPTTRAQALQALNAFITDRLPGFGAHEDAMWTHLDFGWHSLLSSSLNLKLLHPLEVILAAETAWKERDLDLASVEGFIRQILGWREFMRGVYFVDMPGLKTANHYGHQNTLPAWYWTGDTQMNCMHHAISQTLTNGYSHHIQRLMVTGMFGTTAQIKPQQVCDWYLAVYVDAVEWVELPNTAGMALFANGGRFTSKPYIASGAYIKRMSNYCSGCRYKPETRTGADACPMTTLYWNFLDTHETTFATNPRTALMVKNLQRMTDEDRQALRTTARHMLDHLDDL
ncbi:MAG: cryptochrome/photolyase family protein [Polaromonas sp.]|nr:cryptochrome/photolyase family protein [Polaromonas sp.]